MMFWMMIAVGMPGDLDGFHHLARPIIHDHNICSFNGGIGPKPPMAIPYQLS